MKAVKKESVSFSNIDVVDFQKNRKLLYGINILSLFVFIFFYILFDFISRQIGLNYTGDYFFYFKILQGSFTSSLIFIAGLLIMLSVHELIHGFFFYYYTGARPVIGFKSVYAYAGAPEWYIRKKYFYVITLSPLVLITLTGFLFIPLLNPAAGSILFLIITVNAAGSVGDLYMTLFLLTKPEETYINDSGISALVGYN